MELNIATENVYDLQEVIIQNADAEISDWAFP